MICASATYYTAENAREVRKNLIRKYQLITSVQHCEECDAYHVVLDEHQAPFTPRVRKMLEYAALGYTNRGIAHLMETTERTVENSITRTQRRMYALSRTHLVAICIALGMIDPNTFVPQIAEAAH